MATIRSKLLVALGLVVCSAFVVWLWKPARSWSREGAPGRSDTARAPSPQPASSSAKPPGPAAPASLDPEAIAALEKMGAFLRTQQALSIQIQTQTDEVLDSGQKIQLGGVSKLHVRRPNRLHAEVTSDRKQREFFYDGKTFTIYGRKRGYYASFDAPPTLREVVDRARDRYDIELPLADLFYWGTEQSGVERITSAINVGPSRIDGVMTDHYAFRQPDLDWQIWIERGSRPLPRKLVLTTTAELTQPQHVALLSWDLAPKHDARLFEFVPPKGAHRLSFLERGSPPSTAER